MGVLNQQASANYNRTWRFPIPSWAIGDKFSFGQGIYFTLSFGVKVKD